MMDKMMSMMMNNMSEEQKQEMMKKFMGSMSAEEKQNMMATMMPLMMDSMDCYGDDSAQCMIQMDNQNMVGMMAKMLPRCLDMVMSRLNAEEAKDLSEKLLLKLKAVS